MEKGEFNSKEEAFSYYKEHAKSVGFSAIIKASRRSRISGNFIDAKFACTRYGFSNNNSKRPRSDCKASMHVKRTPHGTWIVSSFVRDHNHNLDLPNNQNLFLTRKSPVSKNKAIAGVGVGALQLPFSHEDLQYLLHYFLSMQQENPSFFYAVDFNDAQRLRGVFWVDAKARLDYSHFNDVVLLDTTHLKNQCKLPFVPFVGVNHHFQFLLLGFAFLCDDSQSMFVWLIRMWLRAMGGRSPKVMFTDRDEALKEAVALVIPNSCHCFCLWHVFSKVPHRHGEFMSRFNKCVLQSRTSEQFQKRWGKLVERFDLGDDRWFGSIYDDRQSWIPLYMKDTVLAGMSTVQRSEAISCSLDKFLQRKTTLKEFLEQQIVILQEKCQEEAKADLETLHKLPVLKSPSPFGKQMVKLYTHAIFKKFQSEVLGAVACHPRKESEEGPTKMFRVQDFEDNQDFVVMWNELTSEASCSCCSFELNGFLCRHVLIVLQISGVHNIPSRYILKRWTKDAKSRQTGQDLPDVGVSNSRSKRYDNLCQRAFELGDEGSLSEETYIAAVNALEEALKKCESLNDSIQNVIQVNQPIFGSQEVNLSNRAGCSDKKNSSLKKRQVCPEPEIIAMGINSSWQQVDYPNTQAAGLDFSYDSRQSIQEMDQLNTRAQNLDGYFANQQIDSGMCQLNSIAAVRDDYYSNQHAMQGQGQLNSVARIHDPHYMTPQRMNEMGQPNGGSTQLHGMGLNIKQLNSGPGLCKIGHRLT